MLAQNWFCTKNMIMFDESCGTQKFFDTESERIYVVTDEASGSPTGCTDIAEHTIHSEWYAEMYQDYLLYIKQNTKEYFSKWFNIIPLKDALILWEDGDRSFLILTPDGTDRYASCYENFGQILIETSNGALIGLEREEKKVEDKKEIKTVSPAEFITAWNEMEKFWINSDGEGEDKDRYEQIINQPINIELPLLGIKTELFFCPPTVESLDEMFARMIEDTYFDLLVEKEQCYYTGGGIWIAEVPFEYGEKNLVMVVDSEHTDIWAVYENVLKDNGKWESVEYDELMVESFDANHILPDFQIYYIRALQLLAERNG